MIDAPFASLPLATSAIEPFRGLQLHKGTERHNSLAYLEFNKFYVFGY